MSTALRVCSVVLLCCLAGCEDRTLTQADCAMIKERMQHAWQRDAVAAARLSEQDQFLPFIRDEGSHIGDAWMKQCLQRVGRSVSGDELSCLGKADTIDDIYECGR